MDDDKQIQIDIKQLIHSGLNVAQIIESYRSELLASQLHDFESELIKSLERTRQDILEYTLEKTIQNGGIITDQQISYNSDSVQVVDVEVKFEHKSVVFDDPECKV